MAEKIRIVLSTDLQGMKWNATLLASVARRASRPVEVRIYTRGFTSESFEIRNLKVDFVEADGHVIGRYPGHVSDAVFDRLRIITDEDQWDRVLILDHDMIALCDLGPYFDEDFEGNLLMARSFGPGNTLGLQMKQRGGLPPEWEHTEDYPYFFMGPMMNLRAMREEGTWEKLLRAHREIGQDEQLSLTASTDGRFKAVGKKWNLVPQWDHLDQIAARLPSGEVEHEGLQWRNRCPEGIIHWSEFHKPWHHQSKVWRADLWESEKMTWEHLRRGLWEKPIALEFDPSDNSDLSLLKRGWKVFVKGYRIDPLVEESFPDAEFLKGAELVRADLTRFGSSTALPETLALFEELPRRIVCQGPRSHADIAILHKLGFVFEFRIDRHRWPAGGPHPEVLEYRRVSQARALGYQEDCYFSRVSEDEAAIKKQSDWFEGRQIAPLVSQFLCERFSAFAKPKKILELGDGHYLRVLKSIFPEANLHCLTSEGALMDSLTKEFGAHALYAPLEETLSWFDLKQVELPAADLLIVNGPNDFENPGSRIVATSVLPRLAKGATVMLTDTHKKEIRSGLPVWLSSGCRVLCEGAGYLVLQWSGECRPVEKTEDLELPDLPGMITRSYLIAHPDRPALVEFQKREWKKNIGLPFETVTSLRPDLASLKWEGIRNFAGDESSVKLERSYLERELAWKQGLTEALTRFIRSEEEVALITSDLFEWGPNASKQLASCLRELSGLRWDILVLHAKAYPKLKALSEHLVELKKVNLISAALWKRETAQKLLQDLNDSACEVSGVVDELIPDLKIFGVVPMVGHMTAHMKLM